MSKYKLGDTATAGPGRPPGCKNKIGVELREGILQAFQERGGVKFLKGLKDAEFCSLLRSLIPSEIKASLAIENDKTQLSIEQMVLDMPDKHNWDKETRAQLEVFKQERLAQKALEAGDKGQGEVD
ncbi:MAG: hypothetical protein ACUZ8O_09880 [Candidatus Anammoxibacter sp.]